jgi:hypothetical protein
MVRWNAYCALRNHYCCAPLTFAPYITAKNFIRALLHPDRVRRPTTEQALSHTWFTSFAAPTEYGLCNLRENFDRARTIAQCDRRPTGPVALREK